MEKPVEKPTQTRYSRIKYYVSAGIALAAATALGLLAGAKNHEGVNRIADHIEYYQFRLGESVDRNSPQLVRDWVRFVASYRSGKTPEQLDKEIVEKRQDLEKKIRQYDSGGN